MFLLVLLVLGLVVIVILVLFLEIRHSSSYQILRSDRNLVLRQTRYITIWKYQIVYFVIVMFFYDLLIET